MDVPADLPLHLIGTQAFLPALLAYIQNVTNSPSLPLDHVIFQSLLLCLIAGDKHLILRTPEEDVGLTVKLTVWVSPQYRLVGFGKGREVGSITKSHRNRLEISVLHSLINASWRDIAQLITTRSHEVRQFCHDPCVSSPERIEG